MWDETRKINWEDIREYLDLRALDRIAELYPALREDVRAEKLARAEQHKAKDKSFEEFIDCIRC